LAAPCPSFGKLQLADRLAFGTAALLLDGYPLPPQEKVGISMGVPFGSLSTDMRYLESMHSGYPSPAIFSATLPSSALSEIAIYFGLKGPNRVISEADSSGIAALDAAHRALRLQKAKAMIVIAVYGIENNDRQSPLAPPAISQLPAAAYGFLLTRQPKPEGLGLRLELLLTSRLGAGKPEHVYLGSIVQVNTEAVIAICTSRFEGELRLSKESSWKN
jgi:hypothetical protein